MIRRVVINQSNYLPWKGYFDLIHDADLFIFLDDVQFTKNDWRNRNVIKGPNGPCWLTIPVGPATNRRVDEVPLPGGNWRDKHWRTLVQSYGKAPHFARYETFLRRLYAPDAPWRTLSEFNQSVIASIASEQLGIRTVFARSTDFNVSGHGAERVLGLLKAAGATTYISGPRGRDYLNPSRFADDNIEIIWKDYSAYPVYPQLHPPFNHAVSIVDLLCHVGPEAPRYIWGEKFVP